MTTRALIAGLVACLAASGCARSVRMTLAPEPVVACRAASGSHPPPVVAWFQPDDGGERRALDERCAQVGQVLVQAPGPRPPQAPAVRRVVVATWNMHDGRGDLLEFVETLRRGTPETGAPDAVVILLQEVVRALGVGSVPDSRRTSQTGVQDIPSLVGRLGWHFAYLPGRRNRLAPQGAAAADRGVAILSTLPLSHLEAIELPVERQRRVALSGVVEGTDPDGAPWQLRVVSVHLENRSGARRFWARAGASRTRQTEALLEALALSPTQRAPSPLPTVIGGDFNTWLGPGEETMTLLRDEFMSWPSEDARPTIGVRDWRLDYLFPRLPDHIRSTHRRLESMFGSDHYPVVATLDLGPAESRPPRTHAHEGVTTCQDCN